jgi:hypothetical protein
VSVDPSSLIFVVIIGIWAVYLLQHWVRRREQLATSRSVDRFSEAMRVLERRAPIPVSLPPSQNRPYVVAPTAARPQPAERTPEVAMTPETDSMNGRRIPAASTSRPAGRRTHRLRALILLALLVGTPACWAAHTWGTLLLWPAMVVTGLLVLDLLYIRAVARRAAARRGTALRRTTGAVPLAGSTVRGTNRRPMPRPEAKPFPAPVRRPRSSTTSAQRPVTELVSTSGIAVMTEERVSVHSQDAITEVIVLEGGWEPVAVPPPTYTMKPRADRPAEPAARLEADSDSAPSRQPLEPAVAVDDLDLDAVLDRRRAAGE